MSQTILTRARRTALATAVALLAFVSPASAQGSHQTVSAGGRTGDFYLPARLPAPAVIVLHTAYGRIHAADRQMAKALADAGFVALALEYPMREVSWITPAIDWLKARPEAAGQPLGAVGFSAGAARAFLVANADPQVKAIVSFYGSYDYAASPLPALRSSGLPGPIGTVSRSRAAVLMLHGDADSEVPLDHVERMKQALAANGRMAEAVIYRGAHHNFDRGPEAQGDRTSNGTLVQYDKAAAADSYARTIQWFRSHLR